LIAVLVYTAKIICTTMDVEHYPLSLASASPLPLMVVFPHFNPFCLQGAIITSPLPPSFPTNLLNTIGAELGLYVFRSFRELLFGYLDFVYLDPSRNRDPLTCKCLYVIDCVEGRIM
jgi:hypothetical protein